MPRIALLEMRRGIPRLLRAAADAPWRLDTPLRSLLLFENVAPPASTRARWESAQARASSRETLPRCSAMIASADGLAPRHAATFDVGLPSALVGAASRMGQVRCHSEWIALRRCPPRPTSPGSP